MKGIVLVVVDRDPKWRLPPEVSSSLRLKGVLGHIIGTADFELDGVFH